MSSYMEEMPSESDDDLEVDEKVKMVKKRGWSVYLSEKNRHLESIFVKGSTEAVDPIVFAQSKTAAERTSLRLSAVLRKARDLMLTRAAIYEGKPIESKVSKRVEALRVISRLDADGDYMAKHSTPGLSKSEEGNLDLDEVTGSRKIYKGLEKAVSNINYKS